MRVDPGASSGTRSWPEHGSKSHSHEDCIRKTTPAGVIGTMCSGRNDCDRTVAGPALPATSLVIGHRTAGVKARGSDRSPVAAIPRRLFRRLSALGNSRCRSGRTGTVSLSFPCPCLTETGDKISQRTKITISSQYRSNNVEVEHRLGSSSGYTTGSRRWREAGFYVTPGERMARRNPIGTGRT